jgi:hypothetical protein
MGSPASSQRPEKKPARLTGGAALVQGCVAVHTEEKIAKKTLQQEGRHHVLP